jgi:hypothetical protein
MMAMLRKGRGMGCPEAAKESQEIQQFSTAVPAGESTMMRRGGRPWYGFLEE